MTQSSDKPKQPTDNTAADATKQDPAKKSEQPANNGAEQKQTAAKQPSSAKPQAGKASNNSGSGKGLAIAALIIAIGGLGAGTWSVMQIQGASDSSALQQQEQQQQLSTMQAQTSDLAKREQQLSSALARLPSAAQLQQNHELLAAVQAEQQQLAQRLESVLGASRQDWRLAEAEHLLRMASLRLRALHDTNSARFLLQAADHILKEQNDPAAFAAREQLARSIAALKSNNTIDRTGLFVQLGALHQLASQLTDLSPEFVQDKGHAAGDEPSRWAQWWEHISRYLRIDFNASEQVQPLLAGQSLTQVRLALGLALEQAQWAALNGATEVYQQALQQALDILAAHFSAKDPNVSGLREQIGELREQKVSQELPDLNAALISLEAYIDTRSSLQEPSAEESK